jgi:hypothetical protein
MISGRFAESLRENLPVLPREAQAQKESRLPPIVWMLRAQQVVQDLLSGNNRFVGPGQFHLLALCFTILISSGIGPIVSRQNHSSRSGGSSPPSSMMRAFI